VIKNNLFTCIVAFLLCVVTLHAAGTVERADALQLLPKDAVILYTYPIEEAHRIKYPQTARLYDRRDCILTADMDSDGKDELVVVYSTGSRTQVGEPGTPPAHLNIYKHIKGKWALQYQYAGEPGLNFGIFGVDSLFGTKNIQLVFYSGYYSYQLVVIHYNGKEYERSFVGEKLSGEGDISIYELNNDKKPEILIYSPHEPLPAIYTWGAKTHSFEVLTDTQTLNRFYHLVINSIRSTPGYTGHSSFADDWAIFESYDKLGDSKNALIIGKTIVDGFRDQEGIWGMDIWELVEKRMAQLQKAE